MENSPSDGTGFNPANFRRPQDFSGSTQPSRTPTKIAVRKPAKEWFVRTHPNLDYWYETQVIELKEEGELYLVATEIAHELEEESTFCSKLLVPTVTSQGALFIWPLALSGRQGRSSRWYDSARDAANRAKDQWVRVCSNMAAGAYEVKVATAAYTAPEFPADLPFEKMMEIAFAGRIITSLDHPVLRRLRGEI